MPTPIYGVAPQAGYGAYGGVPGTPNPTSTATEAISGNLGNLGNLYGLSAGVGQASAAGQQQQYIQNLPGYMANRTQQSADIAQELSGQVPDDVIRQIAQQAAEIGAGAGMGPTSPLSNADYLKALGLTSLSMKQMGGTALNQQIQTTPVGPSFNPSTMLVTPAQQQDAALQASIMSAAPNPTLAAMQEQQDLLRAIEAGKTAGNTAAGTLPGANTVAGGVGRVGSAATNAALSPPINRAGTPGAAAGIPTGSSVSPTGQQSNWPFYQPPATNTQSTGSFPGTAPGYDTNGDLWIDLGNGVLLNQSTGETSSSGSSLFPMINYPIAGGPNTGTGTGVMPDYSYVGPDPLSYLLAGDTGQYLDPLLEEYMGLDTNYAEPALSGSSDYYDGSYFGDDYLDYGWQDWYGEG